MIRLLKGYFGNFEGYALLGFESVPIGPIEGDITLDGQVNSGGCSFGMATFGSRI
jgi:hypothetical protein